MKRNSNIELLRIISIFMIILSHYTVHNGIANELLPLGLNRYILEISTLGNIGVIIFLLITGYYNIEKQNPFKIKKLLLLYFQVLFYSITIYCIFVTLGKEKFLLSDLIKNSLPITYKKYWFITAYVVMYIFTPFINKLLNSLTNKEHTLFIIIGIAILTLKLITKQDLYISEVGSFIIFYSIGAFLKKYPSNYFSKKKNITKVFIISICCLLISVALLDIIGTKYNFIAKHSTCLFSKNSIVSILFAVSLFNIFINKKEKNIRFINTISKSVLGVYLISDNFLIRRILWNDILRCREYVLSKYLLLHMIISIVIVFSLCILIDYLRIKIIEPIFIKIYDKTILLFKKRKNSNAK